MIMKEKIWYISCWKLICNYILTWNILKSLGNLSSWWSWTFLLCSLDHNIERDIINFQKLQIFVWQKQQRGQLWTFGVKFWAFTLMSNKQTWYIEHQFLNNFYLTFSIWRAEICYWKTLHDFWGYNIYKKWHYMLIVCVCLNMHL